MNPRFSVDHRVCAYIVRLFPTAACLIMLLWCAPKAQSQAAAQPIDTTTSFSIRVTHLMGFENAPHNASGALSLHDDTVAFEKPGKPAAEIKIPSIQDVSLGGQSRQVGGLPMTLGKTAAPYGGGRVVSLFAHKKYDTLALEYVDSNGGVHGAIFQLEKGRGTVVKNELLARGAHVSPSENGPTKQGKMEAPSESK